MIKFKILLFIGVIVPMLMHGQEVFIENTRNYLYVDFENPIKITTQYPCSEISLESKGCTIAKTVIDCSYSLKIKRPGNVEVIVFRTTNGKKVEIGRKLFKVKRMSVMVPEIRGQESGLIDKALLVSAERIDVTAQNTGIDISFTVLSYQITIIQNKKVVLDQQVVKGNITEGVKKFISNLTAGDKVIFSEILIEDISKIKTTVSPLVYVIK